MGELSGQAGNTSECKLLECETDDPIYVGDDSSFITDCCDFDSGPDDGDEKSAPVECIFNLTQTKIDVAIERRDVWPRLIPAAAKFPVLKHYDECRNAAAYNCIGPRTLIHTGNNIQAWRSYSTGHIDDDWVIDCVAYGFPLQYRGPPLYNGFVDNHPSANNYEQHVTDYIHKEMEMGAIVGPFSEPPFVPWVNIAPLMSREKATSNQRRIIVDLSHPEGSGPNSFIQKNVLFGELVLHVLPTVSDVIQLAIRLNYDICLASLDIARAYRNFALDPYDWPLNCICHKNQFYIDVRMPFGSRLSSLYMQRIAGFITRAAAREGITVVIYLDDILVICPRYQDTHHTFSSVMNIVRNLGLPIAWEKIISPTRAIRFLGIIIDLDKKETRMPVDKIARFLELIDDITGRKFITKRVLQQVLGHINHLGKCVPPARIFMNRLLQCLRQCKHRTLPVDPLLHRDLDWFKSFLMAYNGRSLIVEGNPTAVLEVDSCLIGGGGRLGSRCYAYKYPDSVASNMHISQLEAYNCLIGARVLLEGYSDTCIEVACDNQAATSSLQSGRGRDPIIMCICRAFWFLSAKHNIRFKFSHVPGELMTVADALSRKFLSRDHHDRADAIAHQYALEFVHVHSSHCDYKTYL